MGKKKVSSRTKRKIARRAEIAFKKKKKKRKQKKTKKWANGKY